jgi:preprotein translocase subunit YajC
MFITPAYAQGFSFSDPNSMALFAQFALIAVVFYFLLIRPQQKRAKEHKALLANLRRGDRIVTGGGIIGTIAKVVSDEEVAVDIAENVRVRVLRSTVTSVLARTEPVAGKESGKDEVAAEAEAAPKEKRKGGARG